MKKIIILLVMVTSLCLSQNQVKIDSTINHYFKALDLELSKDKDINKDIFYFNQFTLENGEIIYVNKYANKAIFFFQKITKIPAPTKNTAQSLASYVDEETLKKWKDWCSQNKRKIKWYKKEKTPFVK